MCHAVGDETLTAAARVQILVGSNIYHHNMKHLIIVMFDKALILLVLA